MKSSIIIFFLFLSLQVFAQSSDSPIFTIRELLDLHKMSNPSKEAVVLRKNYHYSGSEKLGKMFFNNDGDGRIIMLDGVKNIQTYLIASDLEYSTVLQEMDKLKFVHLESKNGYLFVNSENIIVLFARITQDMRGVAIMERGQLNDYGN